MSLAYGMAASQIFGVPTTTPSGNGLLAAIRGAAEPIVDWAILNSDSITAGIIASLIVLALQFAVTVAATYVAAILSPRLRLSRLWCFPTCDRIYVVSGSIENASRRVGSVLLAGPDAEAAGIAVATLGHLYPRSNIRHVYCTGFSVDQVKDNVCVVGGPNFNSITARTLEALNGAIRFDADCNLEVFGERFEPLYDSKDRTVEDIGLILQAPNPFDQGARMVAFMGCDTYGVLAATASLSARRDGARAQRDLARALGKRRLLWRVPFAAVVRCQVLEADVSAITLERVYSLEGHVLWRR